MSVLHKQPHHCIVTCQLLSCQGRLVSSPLRMAKWDFELLEPPSCLLTWGSRFLPPYALPSCDLIFLCQIVGKGRRVIVMTANICHSHNHLWYKSYYSYLMDEEIEAEIKLSMFTQLQMVEPGFKHKHSRSIQSLCYWASKALLYISVLPAFSLGLLSQYVSYLGLLSSLALLTASASCTFSITALR